MGDKINFKKNYSKEVFSLQGKRIFSTFIFFFFLLLIFFFLFVSCQNGFCPKKVNSILEKGITGKVIDSSGDFNSIDKLGIIFPNDLEEKDRFSNSISVYGDYLVLGNPYDDDKGTNSGSVYVYKKGSSGEWKYHQKIYGSQISSNSFFGEVVSIYGNSFVVGSYGEKDFDGAVYFFELDSSGNWVEFKRLGLSTFSGGSLFGKSVSIFENKVAIGCPSCRVKTGEFSSKKTGVVYVYGKNNGDWILEKKLNGSKEDSSFGKAVILNKDYIFSSAVDSQGKGLVYSFEISGWNIKDKLYSLSSFGEGFGESLSFYGDSLFIGSSLENTGFSSQDDSLKDWNFGAITDFSLAKEIAYKYGRPLLVVNSGLNCPHARNFDSAIGNSPELVNYAKQNKIVLFLNLYTNYFPDALSSNFDLPPFAGTLSGIFKVTKNLESSGSEASKISHSLKYDLIPVIASSGETAVFNYASSSLSRGGPYPINGILVDKETDSSGSVVTWTAGNYISILNSYFPNQYWSSLSLGGEKAGGAVYVYKKGSSGNWESQQKIVPAGILSKENFGVSISVFGDYLVVGSSNFGSKVANQGAVYIYKKSSSGTWNYMNKLYLSEGRVGDFFGKSVAIQNDSIFVGSNSLEGVLYFKLFYEEFDTAPPVLTLSNYSGFSTSAVSIQILATDNKGISLWKINDTSKFVISQTGLITNKTSVSSGIYSLNVSVYDNSNNLASGIIKIEIKAPFCGDGVCLLPENCSSCVSDCNECPLTPVLYPSDEVKDYTIEWEDISIGTSSSLVLNQSLIFFFIDEEYKLSLVHFNSVNATFNLFHEGDLIRNFRVGLNKTVSLDLNGNDLNDLNLSYLFSVEDSTISVYLKEILEDESNEADSSGVIETYSLINSSGSLPIAVNNSSTTSSPSVQNTSSGNTNPPILTTNKNDSKNKNSSNSKSVLSANSWLIMVIIFCFILIVLVFYFFFSKKNDGSQNKLQKTGEEITPVFSSERFSPRVPQRKFFPPANSPRINRQNLRRNL